MKRLATPPTRLVGRDLDVSALVERLADARLVTLTGLGGVGKSRLALAAAHALARSMPVAYVATLAAKTEVELAVCIAEACELRLDPQVAPLDALVAGLAALPPHLIVLDDFEHLAHTIALLERILAFAPTTLLVTSRVALDRPVESVFPVRPLALDAATTLLRERAGAAPAWADEASLAELAARLDRIPLALELAAGRARIASPDELVALLDGDRQDAAVRWSWEALPPDARSALTTLAFIGTFDLPSAAAALGVPAARALDAIEALEKVSLLLASATPEGTRFQVLETVREFAARHGDPAVRLAGWQRFADALVTSVTPTLDLAAPWTPAALARVFEQREHYLACARDALAEPTPTNVERALRAAAVALPVFERLRQPLDLGRPFVSLLDHPAATAAPAPLRLRALIASILFVNEKPGGRDIARRHEAALPAPTDVDDRRLGAELGIRRGWDALIGWELTGHTIDPEPLRVALELGDDSLRIRATTYEVIARRALGHARLGHDDRLLDEVIAISERNGWPSHRTSAHANAAFLRHSLGDLPAALRHVERGLEAERDDPWLVRERGRLRAELGQLADAADDLARAADALRQMDVEHPWLETTLDQAALALERGAHDLARDTLTRVASFVHTPFERHSHHALMTALARLGDGVAPDPLTQAPTGTVEDVGFALWRGVGSAIITPPEAEHSARVRQALRVCRAAHGVLSSLDDRMLAAGGAWIDLGPKPALRIIWRALVTARMHTVGRGVDKATLAAELWPGERLKTDARDNRLQVNLTTLRKLGLGDAIEAHEGGYRIAPRVALLRVSPTRRPSGATARS